MEATASIIQQRNMAASPKYNNESCMVWNHTLFLHPVEHLECFYSLAMQCVATYDIIAFHDTKSR
jgi:hypothetical protein